MLLYHSGKSMQTCTPPMRCKTGFADFGYGVTSTAVVLQAKRLNTQYPAAHVRQLLILYHEAEAAWHIGRVFGCPACGTRKWPQKSGIITALRLLYPKQKESATAGAALLGDYLPLRLELRFSPNARESEILLSLACMKCLSLSSKERSPVFCNVLRTGAGTACRGR